MRRIGTVRRFAALAAVGVIIGCSPAASGTPLPSGAPTAPTPAQAASPSTAAAASPTTAATSAPDPRFAGFSACDPQPGYLADGWLCDTIDVPLDRADPSAGTIPLMTYVLPHTDLSTPAAEPLFTTPGGPGGPGYENYGIYAMQSVLHRHHDIVTVDPRGTGKSGLIDCPDLQAGFSSIDELRADARACATVLAGRTDRYGAANRAMDMEAVRDHLGYDAVLWYGPSYGSVDAQAYAARYPDRIRALVLDSGFRVDDAAMTYGIAPGYPAALIAILARQCERQAACKGISPDPDKTVRDLVALVRKKPITEPAATVSAGAKPVVVTETTVASLLWSVSATEFVQAAVEAMKGDAGLLVGLAKANPPFYPGGDGAAADFSSGANIAGACNDVRLGWDRSDPMDGRAAKEAALLSSLSREFMPFSVDGWRPAGWFDYECLDWPAPTQFDPVIPDGTTMPSIPTLILSGDVDRSVPEFMSRALLEVFPRATFLSIAGAEHPTFSRQDGCAAGIAARFLETLDVGDTSCATTAP